MRLAKAHFVEQVRLGRPADNARFESGRLQVEQSAGFIDANIH
jgi:hypothetical protein